MSDERLDVPIRGPCFVLSRDAPGEPPEDARDIVARYATHNDGFAGSILGTIRREREWAELTERARRINAELEAKFSRLVRRTAFWLFWAAMVIWAAVVAWRKAAHR
jgi:hypothetical protein